MTENNPCKVIPAPAGYAVIDTYFEEKDDGTEVLTYEVEPIIGWIIDMDHQDEALVPVTMHGALDVNRHSFTLDILTPHGHVHPLRQPGFEVPYKSIQAWLDDYEARTARKVAERKRREKDRESKRLRLKTY